MKKITSEALLDDITAILDLFPCDYLLILLPKVGEESGTAHVSLNIENIDLVALLFAKLMMQGDDFGWQLLEFFQKTDRKLPLALTKLLKMKKEEFQSFCHSVETMSFEGLHTGKITIPRKSGLKI